MAIEILKVIRTIESAKRICVTIVMESAFKTTEFRTKLIQLKLLKRSKLL